MALPRRRSPRGAIPDPDEVIFESIAARVRLDPVRFGGVGDLARSAGISGEALRSLFRRHAHESPAPFLAGARLAHASARLREGISPAAAAAAAGFADGASFRQQFLARAGLTPEEFACLTGQRAFRLRLPPGFHAAPVLRFHARDALGVSEKVSGLLLEKCVLLDIHPCLIAIRLENGLAHCETDAADGHAVHGIVLRLLRMSSAGAAFERRFRRDPLLGPVLARQRGLTIPLAPTPWEALAWAIIGQQIHLSFAISLRRALIAETGELHRSGFRAHPAAAVVARMTVDQLRALRFSGAKAAYLLAAARAVADGALHPEQLHHRSAAHAVRLLTGIRGVGPWTAQYVLLRGLGFADCLPAGDAALAEGLGRLTGRAGKQHRPQEQAIRDLMARFSPHRSLATYHVWASLAPEAMAG